MNKNDLDTYFHTMRRNHKAEAIFIPLSCIHVIGSS